VWSLVSAARSLPRRPHTTLPFSLASLVKRLASIYFRTAEPHAPPPSFPTPVVASSLSQPCQDAPPHHRHEGLHARAFPCLSSSNPVAKVPKEAIELGMLAGNPALGSDGVGRVGARFMSTGSASATIAPSGRRWTHAARLHPDGVSPARVLHSTGSYLGRLNASCEQQQAELQLTASQLLSSTLKW
jgi:hypothetical protein